MAVPHVTLSDAKIVSPPRFRVTDAGLPIWQARLVVADRKRGDDGKWFDGDQFWITVTAYKKLAENAHASLRKDDMVIASGRLVTNEWEDHGGGKHSAPQVILTAIGPSLIFNRRRHESEVRAEVTGIPEVREPAATAADWDTTTTSNDGW